MAITKVINDAVDLNQTSDYSGLRLPVGTTGNVIDSFTADYLVVGGGGGTQSGGGSNYPGGGGAGGLRTSYNNSTTTTNSLSFPSGKTAIATYMLNNDATDISGNYSGTAYNISYSTGKYGGGAVFNGSSSFIQTSLSLNAASNSVSFWFNADSVGSQNAALYFNNRGGRIDIIINGTSSNTPTQYYESILINSTTAIAGWNFVSIVFTGWASSYSAGSYGSAITANVYLNGGSAVSLSPTPYGQSDGLRIGRSGGSYYYDGDIDQVRIYDSALSDIDVSNIYNNEVQALSGGGTAAESSLTLSAGTSYDITVGGFTTTGEDSTFSTITALGGGRSGGPPASAFGSNGGSGGGASGDAYSAAGGNGTLNQGYAGGSSGPLCSGSSCRYPGGGGGGATGIGANATTTTAGNGGDGLEVNIIGGTGNYYAGGGGGSSYLSGAATGGLGGGGNGSARLSGSDVVNDGAANTGGGGGGGLIASSFPALGGSGVVILRYPTASVSSFTTTGTLNTPSTTDTLADNNYPVTNTAYYTLDGNANGYLTTNDLGTFDYPSGTGCIALYELDGNANGYLTTTDLSTVNYPAGAGCVALYELNGNANDTSNTYNGGATNVTYDNGAFDQAAVFNGSSSYISANDPNSGGGARSFSAWIKTTSTGFQSIITNGGASHASGLNMFVFNNKLYSTSGNGSGENYGPTSSADVNTGAWVHCVLTMSGTAIGSTLKTYVNGTLDGTHTTTVAITDTYNAFRIGGRYINGSYAAAWFDGEIDQVRIFNTELTQSQVTTLARGIATSYSGEESNITYDTGAFGKAAVFNGSSSKITVPDSSDNLNFSNHIGTISAWVNLNSFSAEPIVCKRGTGNPGARSYIFNVTTGGVINWYTYNTDSNQQQVSSTSTISANRWYHLAVTLDQTNIKIYIDGVLDKTASSTYTSIQDDGADFTIGYRGNNSGFVYADGSIDQVRIFNTALSASDVATLARGAGTAYNAVPSNITWTNGKFNEAALFNGSTSEITINNFATLNQVGLSFWVNLPDVTAQAGLITKYAPSNREFAIYTYGGSMIASLYYNGNNGNAITINMTSYMSNNTWHHIAYSADGSTQPKLYIDGVQRGTAQSNNNTYYSTSEPILLGAFTASTAYALEGKIDQVRVFPTALSSTQVTDLYNEHYQTKFTDGSDTAIVFTEGTGTVTFSGTSPAPPQGVIRANTSYSEDGSASVIEHYNGTEWKYFDAVKYCTTNTLNFPPGAGCIASYNFNNNVNDIGNTLNGTSSNLTFTSLGKFGAAAVFNGSSSAIDLPTGDLGLGTNNFSVSLWFNSADIAQDDQSLFWFQHYQSPIRIGAALSQSSYGGDGDIRFYCTISGTGTNANSNSDIFSSNTWYHVVFVKSSISGMAVYVNGSSTPVATNTGATGAVNNNISSNGKNTIGAYTSSTAHLLFFNGKIDQFRMFNTTLTQTQIEDLYINEIACS